MINVIPSHWICENDLEMLFLFYQSSDELLSEVTPDTFSLPLHNAVTLVEEINDTFLLMKKYNIIEEYYVKYIPPIIDELFSSIENDYLLKKELGLRLSSILTGFGEAQHDHSLLERWVSIFRQSCPILKYLDMYKKEIIRLITETKDKNNLLYCISNYYITLINIGYSREHLYNSSKKFFNNKKIEINSCSQIADFLDAFDCVSKPFTFLILMDINTIEYLDRINVAIIKTQKIEIIDVEKERENLCRDHVVNELFNKYDNKLRSAKNHQNIAIVRVTDNDLDPYKSVIRFDEYISFLQIFKRYFIHHSYSKDVYSFLLQKPDGQYVNLNIPKRLNKRPFLEQSMIDSRISDIVNGKALSPSAFNSLSRALEIHAESFDSSNKATILRTLWTGLEALFSNPNPKSTRKNEVNSILLIVQKTYILKILRALYTQLTSAISTDALTELNIKDFNSFIEYFSTYSENSDEMKKIYNYLSSNPLLRSRIFNTRKKFSNGKKNPRIIR